MNWFRKIFKRTVINITIQSLGTFHIVGSENPTKVKEKMIELLRQSVEESKIISS